MNSTILLGRLSSVLKKVKNCKDVMFNRYLFLTNMGLSFGLSGAGDMLQQHYSILNGEKDHWNQKRTSQMCVTGLTVGLVCHHWYKFLDNKLPGKAFKIVIKKVLIDQLFFSPVYITVFFVTSGLLERSSLEEIADEIIQKGKLLYAAEWIVWPPAQFINFLFLPTKYRILYDSTISLGYDVYTSYVKHEVDDAHSPSDKK